MIAIVQYNAGNVASVQNALARLGYKSIITNNDKQIRDAEKVIFPGVGEASSAMRYLKEKKLDSLISSLKQPVLGICLGMQLMCSHTEEGNTACLNIFQTNVKRFPAKGIVPHMGWNNLCFQTGALFKGVQINTDVYFVHSFYAEKCVNTIAECNYLLPFSAAIQKDNFYATQFHPEKSASVGEQILKNFLEL